MSADRTAKKILLDGFEQQKRRQIRLQTAAIAAVFLILWVMTAFTYGRINAEEITKIRERGMTADAWLENGKGVQDHTLASLDFVERVGREKAAGLLKKDGRKIGIFRYADEETFEKMLRPAYGMVTGSYPRKREEIMLSVSCLEDMGISEPQPGMKLPLELDWYGMKERTGGLTFVLSGYFEDYAAAEKESAPAYISWALMEENDVDLYPARILIDVKAERIGDRRLEIRLYDEAFLYDADQVYVVPGTIESKAVQEAFGGYGVLIFAGGLILLCLGFFIYHLQFLTLYREEKNYWLLQMIGTSRKQIRDLYIAQTGKLFFRGVTAGTLVGIPVVFRGIPALLNRLYMSGQENRNWIFAPGLWFWIGTALTVAAICLISVLLNLEELNRMLEEESGANRKIRVKERRTAKTKRFRLFRKMDAVSCLAIQNLLCSRKKLLLSVLTLFLGCETALCATVIFRGLDSQNERNQNPDFQIGITKEALDHYPYAEAKEAETAIIFDKTLLEEEALRQIARIAEIPTERIGREYGCLAKVDDVNEAEYFAVERGKRQSRSQNALAPFYNNSYGLWDGTGAGYYGIGILRVLEEEEMGRLKDWVKENGPEIDWNKLIEENGTLIAHGGALSREKQDLAGSVTGRKLWLYPVNALYPKEDTYIEKGQLENLGYLDYEKENFPVRLNWNGKNILYFLISPQTLKKVKDLPVQTFRIFFDVDPQKEEYIKKQLKSWVRDANVRFRLENRQRTDLLSLTCNSDLTVAEAEKLKAEKIMIFCLSMAFCTAGIMNFFNLILSDLLGRKKEIFILRDIGMTSKQMNKMFRLEGLFYWASVWTALLTAGSGILWLVQERMKQQKSTFVFLWPVKMYVIIAAVSLAVCFVIPKAVYNRLGEKKSEKKEKESQ